MANLTRFTRRVRLGRALAIGGLVVSLLSAGAAPLQATESAIENEPPSSSQCRAQFGTTGLLYLNGLIPTPESIDGSGGWGQAAPKRLKLPERITFKDTKNAIADRYFFAVREGNLYGRSARGVAPAPRSSWRVVRLPECLAGQIRSVSADGNVLTVVGRDRQLYSHDMPGGDLSPQRWTWRWGPYFWTGSGVRLPADAPQIAASELSSDETFTDTAGRRHNAIGVMTGYLLRGDGRRITYVDPWLPSDESREVCGPRRGSARLASLDATGSTVFTVTRNGDLYTRLYDFDISGANYVFGTYNWRDKSPDPQAWQLPAPQWVRQPTPPGRFTDRITIVTTGKEVSTHRLRVEGWNRRGERGYWTKVMSASSWRFIETGHAIRGDRLTVRPARPAAGSVERTYLGRVAGKQAKVSRFNADCSPARLTIDVAPRARLELSLLSADALRQGRRSRGLDDVPRWYNGAIVVPKETWRTLRSQPPSVRRFIAENLEGRVTPVPLKVTATRLSIDKLCWELTANGRPARPDKIGEPDPAVQFGTLLAAARELPARPPSVC